MKRLLIALSAALLVASGAPARAGTRAVRRLSTPGEGVLRLSNAELASWGLSRGRVYVYTDGRGIDYVRTKAGIEVYSAPYEGLYAAERALLVSDRALPYAGKSLPLRADRSGEGFGRYSRFRRRGKGGKKVTDGPTSYVRTVHVEEDQFYMSGMTGALPGEEHWFYSTFLMPGRSLELTADLAGPLASGPVRVKVALRGAFNVIGVNPDHSVEVRFNGQLVGTMIWEGNARREQSFEVPAGLAVEGANSVKLTGQALPGVAFDFVCADWVEVSYPRKLVAVGDRLNATISAGASQRVAVGGFSGPDVTGLDVTDPARPQLLALDVRQVKGSWVASWVTNAAGRRSYALAGPGGRLAASSQRAADPWDARLTGGHRYLVVSHADYMQAAGRLVALHGGRRGRVRLYAAEDVYDAFGCGQAIPEAIRALVRHHGPQYLCLVGDASADMRGRLGAPGAGLLPSFLAQGPHFEEASDNLFGCVSGGDEYPEVAVGRLPARTAAEAGAMVDKVAARLAVADQYGGSQAALVVGDDDMALFEEGAREIAGLFSWGGTDLVLFSDHGNSADVRAEIIAGWKKKPRYFVFYGHASTGYLGKGKELRAADVPALDAEELPAGVILGCLAGYFNFTFGNDSLAERLIKEPGKGVCALVAPSGMSAPEGQLILGREIAKIIKEDRKVSLGRALMLAKRRLPAAHSDVLRSFNLLGDPALR